MNLQNIAHDVKIRKGEFAQCDRCKMWVKISRKPDRDGRAITIALRSYPDDKRWLCKGCCNAMSYE